MAYQNADGTDAGSVSLNTGYYVLASYQKTENGNTTTQQLYAPINADGTVGAFNLEGQKMPEVTALKVVKYTGSNGSPALSDLTGNDAMEIGEGGMLLGPTDKYKLAYPTDMQPADRRYVITATKVENADIALAFVDASENPVTPTLTGSYYLLAGEDEDGTGSGAAVFTDFTKIEANGNLYPAFNAPVNTFKVVAYDGENPSINDLKDLPEVTVLDEEYALTYPDAAVNSTYTIQAKAAERYPATIDFYADAVTPDTNVTLSSTTRYFLLGKDCAAEITAPASGASSSALVFKNAEGQSVNVSENMSFSVVKYTGADANPSLETLRALASTTMLGQYSVDLAPVLDDSDPNNKTLRFQATRHNGYVITVATFDYDETTPKAPDTIAPIGDDYYLRVLIQKKVDGETETWEDCGWTLLPVGAITGASKDVLLTEFVLKNQNPRTQTTKIPFNPAEHRIDTSDLTNLPIRMIKLKGDGSGAFNNYDGALNANNIDDNPPDKYAFNTATATEGGVQINLYRAAAVDYNIRLKFGGADSKDDIQHFGDHADVGSVYARVTVTHSGGSVSYAMVRLTDAMKKKLDNGDVVMDVPVTEWIDASGNVVDETFTGKEQSIKVELVAAPKNITLVNEKDYPVPTDSALVILNPQYNDQGEIAANGEGKYLFVYEVVSVPNVSESFDTRTEKGETDPETHTQPVYDIITLRKPTTITAFDYSLENVLNEYNMVTLCPNGSGEHHGGSSSTTGGEESQGTSDGVYTDGDVFLVQHAMGAVLIRGDLIFAGGSGVGDSKTLTKSSVINGKVLHSGNNNGSVGDYVLHHGQTVNTRSGSNPPPFILGAENTVYGTIINGENVGVMNPNGITVGIPDYIDWDKLQGDMKGASASLYARSTEVIDVVSRLDAGGTANITVYEGQNITLDYSSNPRAQVNIFYQGGTNETAAATIINVISNNPSTDNILMPLIQEVNGEEAGSFLNEHSYTGTGANQKEDGEGMSVLYNFPNAYKLTVPSDDLVGHVLAPYADVRLVGSNYNGCVVANSIYTASEGHRWPYTGPKGTIIPTSEGFVAYKRVNNRAAKGTGQVYSFKLEKFIDGTWGVINTAQNAAPVESGETPVGREFVEFPEITYSQNDDGKTYYYRVSEDASSVNDGSVPDSTLYIAKVVVQAVTVGDVTTYEHTTTYYKVTGENPVSGEGFGTLDTNKVEPLGEFDLMKFNNTKQGGLTVTKEVTGTTAKDVTFKFRLTLIKNVDPSSDPSNTDHPFEVSGITKSVNGGTAGVIGDKFVWNDNKASYEFTLTSGQSVNFTGIEDGLNYKVEEIGVGTSLFTEQVTTIGGYSKVVIIGGTGIISQSTPVTVTAKNKYEAEGTVVLRGGKRIDNRAFSSEDTLRVTIASTDGPLPAQEYRTQTVALTAGVSTASFSFGDRTNGETGDIIDEIKFTQADMTGATVNASGKREKTFTYTLTEAATMAGTTATVDTITATVTVTDNGNGTLSTSVTYDPEDATFVNTYDTSTTAEIEGTKVLTGATDDKPANGQFTFKLEALEGVPMPTGATTADGKTSITVTNDANGDFEFPAITYPLSLMKDETADENNVKTRTFNYTVSEVADDDDDTIIYTTQSVNVTVTVTYNTITGVMAATVDPQKAGMTFTNIKKGALKLTKEVTVNDAADDTSALTDGTYIFTIEGAETDTADYSETVAITFANGKATKYKIGNADEVTISTAQQQQTGNNWSVVIPNLVPGDYTITEDKPSGGVALKAITGGKSGTVNVTDRTVTVTVEAGDTTPTASAAMTTFTNNVDTGSLSLTKAVNPETATDQTFTFTVTLTPGNTPIDTTALKLGDDAFATGKVTKDTETGVVRIEVEINGGETKVISGIPVGTTYTVTEADVAGWRQVSTVYSDDTNKTIALNEGDTVTITNEKLGALKITKAVTVNGSNVDLEDADGTFTFYVDPVAPQTSDGSDEPQSSDGPATHAHTVTITFTGGVPTACTVDGENQTIPVGTTGNTWSVVIPNLVPGDYVITEALDNAAGFSLRTITGGKSDANTTEGTITATVTAGDTTPTSTAAQVTYTNNKVKGSTTFAAKKTFTNGNLSQKQFAFRLTQVAGNEATTPVTQDMVTAGMVPAIKLASPKEISTKNTELTAEEEIAQIVHFTSEIAFDKTDIGQTYWFMIEEIVPEAAQTAPHIVDHVKYDVTRHWVKVEVTEDNNGAMVIAKTPSETEVTNADNEKIDAYDAEFTNEQLGKLIVTKSFGDTEGLTDDQLKAITFTITGPTGFTAIENLSLGDITSTPHFEETVVSDVKTYVLTLDNIPLGEYTVTENNADVDRYTRTTTYKVNGTETNVENDPVTVEVPAGADGATVDVTNSYTPELINIVIEKKWQDDTGKEITSTVTEAWNSLPDEITVYLKRMNQENPVVTETLAAITLEKSGGYRWSSDTGYRPENENDAKKLWKQYVVTEGETKTFKNYKYFVEEDSITDYSLVTYKVLVEGKDPVVQSATSGTISVTSATLEGMDGTIELTNQENAKYSLPETGGMGRGAVYAAGALLVLAAAMLLALEERKRVLRATQSPSNNQANGEGGGLPG